MVPPARLHGTRSYRTFTFTFTHVCLHTFTARTRYTLRSTRTRLFAIAVTVTLHPGWLILPLRSVYVTRWITRVTVYMHTRVYGWLRLPCRARFPHGLHWFTALRCVLRLRLPDSLPRFTYCRIAYPILRYRCCYRLRGSTTRLVTFIATPRGSPFYVAGYYRLYGYRSGLRLFTPVTHTFGSLLRYVAFTVCGYIHHRIPFYPVHYRTTVTVRSSVWLYIRSCGLHTVWFTPRTVADSRTHRTPLHVRYVCTVVTHGYARLHRLPFLPVVGFTLYIYRVPVVTIAVLRSPFRSCACCTMQLPTRLRSTVPAFCYHHTFTVPAFCCTDAALRLPRLLPFGCLHTLPHTRCRLHTLRLHLRYTMRLRLCRWLLRLRLLLRLPLPFPVALLPQFTVGYVRSSFTLLRSVTTTFPQFRSDRGYGYCGCSGWFITLPRFACGWFVLLPSLRLYCLAITLPRCCPVLPHCYGWLVCAGYAPAAVVPLFIWIYGCVYRLLRLLFHYTVTLPLPVPGYVPTVPVVHTRCWLPVTAYHGIPFFTRLPIYALFCVTHTLLVTVAVRFG